MALLDSDIARRARGELPVTWDALSSVTDGVQMLQDTLDDVKYSLFATVVDPDTEADLYTRDVLRYAGLVTALQVIPAGIDWWGDQPTSKRFTGTDESENYPDRQAALFKLYTNLAKQIQDLMPYVATLLAPRVKRRIIAPVVGDGGGVLITPDPWLFPGQKAGA